MESTRNVTTVYKEHTIICDNCGRTIAIEAEHEDGWYPNHEVSMSVFISRWFDYKGQFCDKCWDEKVESCKKLLIDFGFKPKGA